ncbi:MAG: hypothetical protein EPO06_11750 [Burkholderiaceae bacterium]|nr:MAG: hypothetical protein EPO06_11750 [Burkholderiaceae bacterium]
MSAPDEFAAVIDTAREAYRRRELFDQAVRGEVEVPLYTVGVGPEGEFVAEPTGEASDDDMAVIAGDCRRAPLAAAWARLTRRRPVSWSQ